MNKIVTICGSFKYKDMMLKKSLELELEDKYIVLQPVYGIDNYKYTDEDKKILGELHYKRIDISDAIYVVNVDGYIGESTKKEIEYAKRLGKEILYLEDYNKLIFFYDIILLGCGSMKKLIELFLTMLKIGTFTFGGGYSMIAFLESELVEKKKWIERDDFLNMIAIAESTPGPIAINSATYIGYKMNGLLGSILCTLGVVLPAFIIMFIISLYFDQFLKLKYISYAFKGIQIGVIYLILRAGIRFYKNLDKSLFNIIIISLVMFFMILFSLLSINFSSIYFILICGFIGMIILNKKEVK